VLAGDADADVRRFFDDETSKNDVRRDVADAWDDFDPETLFQS
jgi:hypothetical protein